MKGLCWTLAYALVYTVQRKEGKKEFGYGFHQFLNEAPFSGGDYAE